MAADNMPRWFSANRRLRGSGARDRCAIAMALVALLVSGCNQGPQVAQVSGKVLYPNGEAPTGGVCVVRFEPLEGTSAEVRQGASGAIGPDGAFEMATKRPGDGVHLGEYAVTFAVWKGPRDPTSLIKEKYTTSTATPYRVEITGDRDDLEFEIEPK